MLEFIKKFRRRKQIQKYQSTVPTGFMPVKAVHSAVAFVDAMDPYCDRCKDALMAFYRENGIKGEIFFFDFRKIGKEERLITSIQTTVLKKDLNWFGRPSHEKINIMLGSEPDLFISLIDGTDFPLEFMAKCSQAKFKVGRVQLPGNTFDLIVADPQDRKLTQKESFDVMKSYLAKIG